MNLKAMPLTKEDFAPYGRYFIISEGDTSGASMDYIADVTSVVLNDPVSGIGVLYADRQEPVITQMELHRNTDEGWIVLDGPCVSSFGTPCDDPNESHYKAFYIPAGTVLSLGIGVWHYAPLPCGDKRTTVLAILLPNTPEKDIEVVPLKEAMTISM